MPVEFSRGFYRVRAWIFVISAFLSLVWATLLSVFLFVLYARTDAAQRNLAGVLIVADAITAVMLPALLVFKFRPWLDGARVAFLLVVHVGPTLLLTIWTSSFNCPSEPSQYKTCKNLGLALMGTSWVVPALLVFYAAFLLVMYHNPPQYEDEEVSPPSHTGPRGRRLSHLPIMPHIPRRPSARPSELFALGKRPGLLSRRSSIGSNKSSSVYSVATTHKMSMSQVPLPPLSVQLPSPSHPRSSQQISQPFSPRRLSQPLSHPTSAQSSRLPSVRSSGPPSIPSASSATQTSLSRPPSQQPISAGPSSRGVTPASPLPSHIDDSVARVYSNDPSPRSSGRLSKPAPWAV